MPLTAAKRSLLFGGWQGSGEVVSNSTALFSLTVAAYGVATLLFFEFLRTGSARIERWATGSLTGAVVAHLVYLQRNPERATRLRRQARRTAERFTWNQVIHSHIAPILTTGALPA